MTFEQASQRRDDLDAIAGLSSKALQVFPRGANGLTPDAVKFSSEYRAAQTAFNIAFRQLRDFNGWYLKAFAAEIKASRSARNYVPDPKSPLELLAALASENPRERRF